jgi:hypothetical protein
MIRAIALDIDGTLTDDTRRIHLGAVDALRDLEGRGVPIVMATGNILCLTEAIAIMTGASGPVIAENGGIIKDRRRDETLIYGDITEPQRAFDHLKKHYKIKKLAHSELRKTEVAIYRTVAVEDLARALGDYDVELVDTKFAIHIKKKGINKGQALVEVAELMGLDVEDFAAVGDSASDREMLEVAGYAVSVGEGGLEDVSDYITQNRFGDGGQEALEKIASLV